MMKSVIPSILAFCLFACEPAGYRITLDTEAAGAVVSFPLPQPLEPGTYRLTGDRGDKLFLQVDEDGTGWFIAGRSATYRLDPRKRSDVPKAMAIEDGPVIRLRNGDRDVLAFYHQFNSPADSLGEVYRRAGYIHPVVSPEGVVVTGHLNGPYHMHHSGIWSAWTRTRFQGRAPDFWNAHQGSARVDLDTLKRRWSGPVHAGLDARNRFTDLGSGVPVTALTEDWTIRAYAIPASAGYHLFEVDLAQHLAGPDSLFLPEYLYGGFGFRGHPDWRDTTRMKVLTSEGYDRIEGHAMRSRWVAASGESGGRWAGAAILGHPRNVRFPQPMRIHPTEPFINYAPMQLGDMVLVPGQPYRMRYRVVVFDGEPDADLIERLWRQYAEPPVIRVDAISP